MMPQQITQKIKADINQGSAITLTTLNQLKKFFDEMKNNQANLNARPQQSLQFKEKIIGQLLLSLKDGQHSSKEKILILEILQRDLISSKHNVSLFNRFFHYLQQEDENVAIQASKSIDALIKQINESSQATPNAQQLDTKTHYIRLFEFLKDKTQFLLKLNEHVKEPEYKVYKRTSYEDKSSEKDKKQIVFKNSKSLKFINQVPHLFIHLMAYVDTGNRMPEDDAKIKELIRKSISNIIQSLRNTPYEEFYNEFNYEFNNQLFGVMTKLLQFLFINLRNDKENSSNKSSINLKKHIGDQIEYIRVNEVIKNFIHLLKNCSQDFHLNRYEIVNRLKLLLNNLERTKLNRHEAIEIMNQILNEDIIFGKKKTLGDYSRNAICSYWIQMIRSPVLISNVFQSSILSIKMLSQTNITEDSPQIANCFANIEKLFEEILKTIFDNSFYPTVQEKCIELIIYLIDFLFPDGLDSFDNIAMQSANSAARRIQQNKLRILLRILDCVSLKFMSIRHIFQEIDEYITKKVGHKINKKELPQPLKLDYMQLNSLNLTAVDNPTWQQDVIDFIQGKQETIDNSLLTVSVIQNKFITIYEEDDQLCFNSHPVKSNNYTIYMRDIKTKLLEKCINLAHKIAKAFLSQNIEVYTQMQIQSLKSIYFVLSNKRSLTGDQCKILSSILKNGLKIFETLHNYDLHSDDQSNKKGHLKNFMLIFAQIYDPVNFRDIFEPNMNDFFSNLIMYAKNCADYCLQFVLIEPYCSNSNQSQPFNKNIVELLTYNLILRLESTSDQLDPFHQFYEYKQQYFLLLQKLIRFPFRCLSRYADESFIRNYFRQIILFLTKKAHTSRFCLDYLHLMRTLFKNILFNSNRQAASPLFSEFYAICCKTSNNSQTQNVSHSVFININILDNFSKLYQTGIPQLADIVTQLIIMLPLKSKHIIQFAKQGYIVKPLLHCLCLMSDYNYLLRTLKTFEIIISHSTAQEINVFLDGVKDKLINRLFEMVVNEYKSNDLKPDKINNDLSSLSLKLLAKLGALSRNRDIPIQIKNQYEVKVKNQIDFKLIFSDFEKNRTFSSTIANCVEYAIQIFYKLLDPYYQSIIFISMETIEKNFELLVQVLPTALAKMHPLSEKIINVFSNILNLSSKYLTISQSILNRIREDVKNEIKKQTQNIKNEIKSIGLTEYSKFFIKSLVMNLSQRVLITREENFIKEISQEPKKFLWGLILSIIENLQQETQAYNETCEYIISLLISSAVMINNPQQIVLNRYQKDQSHILPYKNAALGALSDLIDKCPLYIIQQEYLNILQASFISLSSIPDILNLKIMKHPRNIAKKIYKILLKDEQKFLQSFKTEKTRQFFTCILQNICGYSYEAHQIAIEFLHMIMKQTTLNLHQLLYNNQPWEQICDQNYKYQSKYSFMQFIQWDKDKKPIYPIVTLARSLAKITHNVNQESLKNNPTMLKLLNNCYCAFQLLVNIKGNDGKTYQAFQMLIVPQPKQEGVFDENIVFNETFKKLIAVCQTIIDINEKIYENYTKIIIEQPNTTQQQQQAPRGNQISQSSQRPLQRARDPTQVPPTSPNQSFQINTNTFIDDEEYGINIEDLDTDIKIWGRLISSILRFLKNILVNDIIFSSSKIMLKKKNDKSKLVQVRLDIIFRMFELINRVDKSVRQTSYQCLKELLSREDHPKDLIQNDEKLKHILRPVLISLQLDFKKFTPSFLHMFKKILKLLTQCFNITLIQKLVDKLKEMQKSKQMQLNNQSKPIQPQQPIKYLNYSEINLEIKCIANFLGLFQYLAFAFHNHRNTNYTVNSIIMIFKYVGNISNYFTPKLGKQTIKNYIKKSLAKVLNTMCQKLSGESIFVDGHQKQLDIESFLEILKLEDSYSLRQKLTRQTNYLQKSLDKGIHQYNKTKSRKDYIIFLEVIYVFTKHNSKWMKGCFGMADKIGKEIHEIISLRMTPSKFDDKKQFEFNQRNQLILLCKIMIQFYKQNPQDFKPLFALACTFKIRSTFDLNFIKKFFRCDLYDLASTDTKKKIFNEFLNMLKSFSNSLQSTTNQVVDADKILSISQNIIYPFILTQLQRPEEERCIFNNDQQFLQKFVDTIKACLNPKILHNKSSASHLSVKQSSNVYRISIEVLQISNLAMPALKNFLNESLKNIMLFSVWGLLRIEDKIIKNYAFVWTSNFIKTFETLQTNKALGLYLTLIRGLQGLSQGDYEIGALIKKSLNILIPYWDNTGNTAWIDWSLKAVHEQTSQPNKLVRFWQIVVKNHKIFHKYKQSKFETQMVNSMQWLMVANNPTSSNPLVKKIASDMSFIYIEWKYQEVRNKLKQNTFQIKNKILEESLNDRAAEICLNFFIKVALNNSSDKDDKEIMRRSLYLLKKTLILWPNTKKKFQNIKTIVNKLKTSMNMQSLQVPLRFHYTLLSTINILLSYESDNKLLPQLTIIFRLLELGHIAPNRFPSNTHNQQQTGSTIFTMNNIYLLNLLCVIMKRLVSIAMKNEKQEQSHKFLQEIHQYIRDGFEHHVLTGNKGRMPQPTPQSRPPPQLKKIEIEVAVSFLKILYDLDQKSVDIHLNYIKQVTSSLKKMFEKGFQTSSKGNNPNRVYELPPLNEGSFFEMLNKELEINIQLIKPDNLSQAEQNYQKDNIKSYATRRPLFVILIRILASKFNSITHPEDQNNILDLLISIYDKIPDPQLKLQIINIFKCMFIGGKIFKDNEVPERYRNIQVINYPIKKIFHLFFEDSNKFNEHFQRRKSKPSDQNYNINQRIYEEITTKIYFNFLAQFIINLPQREITFVFMSKIKIFILYAVKIVDSQLLDQLFVIIDRTYESNCLELYVNLFEDYRELNCTEQNLQGDQISLFFTYYLYKKAISNYNIEVQLFANKQQVAYHSYFLGFLRSDISSPYHQKSIFDTLKLSIKLLPPSKKLPKVLKQYLMYGSYNQAWGSIILKIALDLNCLNSQQLYSITARINEWGTLLKVLQSQQSQNCRSILDFTYRAYGDKDLIYGYRINSTKSSSIRLALINLQQRKYLQTLKHITIYNDQKLKTKGHQNDAKMQDTQETKLELESIQNLFESSLISDISKECYKSLNQWDDLVETKQLTDNYINMEYLFHSNGSKDKINNVLHELEKANHRQFAYYYGKSILNFLESTNSHNKQLNISLLYSLLEWLSFPRNAKANQNKMLVKIECLLELEQGQKIKEESLSGNSEQPSLVEALTKVVQSVYTQINSWRERMPDKNEDLTVWHSLLSQRIMIYEFMKNKMVNLLDNVIKNQSNLGCTITSSTQKLLTPYTDIQWNKLNIIRQQRNFLIFNKQSKIKPNQSNLYLDEIFIRQKQKFYQFYHHQKHQNQAISHLEKMMNDNNKDNKDDELAKIQKLEIIRLKGKILIRNQNYVQANNLFMETIKGVEQHLLPLWRDWLVLSLRAFEKTGKIEWACSAISTLPYALREKTHKTKLIMAPLIHILIDHCHKNEIKQSLDNVIDFIPNKIFHLWFPQLLRIVQSKNSLITPLITRMIEKLAICYPQTMYYLIKPFFKSPQTKLLKQIYQNTMKKTYANLLSKLDNFTQCIFEIHQIKDNKIPINILGEISRSLTQLFIPLYQNWKGQIDPIYIPTIALVDQILESEIINGVDQKVISLVGSDNKEYKLGIEDKRRKVGEQILEEHQAMLISQSLQIFNSHLTYWRESTSRKLTLHENRKINLLKQTQKGEYYQQLKLIKSNNHSLTPLDILNEYMQQTTYGTSYPQSDKQLYNVPKKKVNQNISKRMKEIVGDDVLVNYLVKRACSYDDFINLRRVFSYEFGVMSCYNHIFSLDTNLDSFTINLKTGYLKLYSPKLNYHPQKLSHHAIRLSTNFSTLLSPTYLNSGVLPSFITTVDALYNQKLNYKAYLKLFFSQLERMRGVNIGDFNVFERIQGFSNDYDRVVKLIEVSKKVGKCKDVEPELKYWF